MPGARKSMTIALAHAGHKPTTRSPPSALLRTRPQTNSRHIPYIPHSFHLFHRRTTATVPRANTTHLIFFVTVGSTFNCDPWKKRPANSTFSLVCMSLYSFTNVKNTKTQQNNTVK
jgi:hypothetical protein